jgi:hypothetical protein
MYFYFKLRAMILEDETFNAFGYYPKDLLPKSGKRILAACNGCGKVRIMRKNRYRALCYSCCQKGKTGDKNGNYKGGLLTCVCLQCGREFKVKQYIIKAGYGKYCSISCARKGNTNCLGRVHTEETKALISAAAKLRTGDKSSNWKGGISFEPYCVKFNEAFKEYIRAKFGYKCFLCPTTQAENGRKLCVHHVNYNKQCGCDGDDTCNFVPLCMSCHTKTNGNRDYWRKLITDKLHDLIIGWDV